MTGVQTCALPIYDPSADNEYIYKDGSALLLSGTYSRKGLSAMLQVKRSDNMAYRSIRTQRGSAAFINYLPAFTQTHTYALAALRPYATQPAGEWAIQGNHAAAYASEHHIPMLGICRGMQLLNVACGGSLYQDIGEREEKNLLHAQQLRRDTPSREIGRASCRERV